MDWSRESRTATLHRVPLMRDARALGRLERARLRRLLRESNSALIIAAGIVDIGGGGIASSMVSAADYLHAVLFGLPDDARLSAIGMLNPVRMLVVLATGGLMVGMLMALRRRRVGAIVDPIEANALHGGRMSAWDSTFVAVQTVLSSGFGASLGLEGGFTQAAGAIGSIVGATMRRRRHDMRMLVAAGAAGAIAGAFGAPTAGAAYGFELILGSYTVTNLAPIVVAALAGTYASQAIFGQGYRIWLGTLHFAGGSQFLLLLFLGVTCGLLAVVLMRGVTATERIASAAGVRPQFRPAAGGLLLAILGLLTPHAPSSRSTPRSTSSYRCSRNAKRKRWSWSTARNPAMCRDGSRRASPRGAIARNSNAASARCLADDAVPLQVANRGLHSSSRSSHAARSRWPNADGKSIGLWSGIRRIGSMRSQTGSYG